jgi:hypothetical protein
MRRNSIVRRELEAHDEHPLFGGVAIEDGYLRTRKDRWSFLPLHLIRIHHRVLSLGKRGRQTQRQSGYDQYKFHDGLPIQVSPTSRKASALQARLSTNTESLLWVLAV